MTRSHPSARLRRRHRRRGDDATSCASGAARARQRAMPRPRSPSRSPSPPPGIRSRAAPATTSTRSRCRTRRSPASTRTARSSRASPSRGSTPTDGTAITFTLRDGLTFSDGEPVDAEAVKAFFDRGKTQEDSHLKDQLADLESVTADSELEVTLHLAEVDYQIPYLVAGRTGAIASPKAAEDPAQLAIEPVGAGPFILTEFVAESHATFEKNPDYWDAENIHIDKLNLKPRLDAATVVAAIQSGSVDVAVIPATQVDAAKGAGHRRHGRDRR